MTCDMCAMGQNRQNSLEHNESGYSSIADVRADLDRRWWLCANCRRDSGRQKASIVERDGTSETFG